MTGSVCTDLCHASGGAEGKCGGVCARVRVDELGRRGCGRGNKGAREARARLGAEGERKAAGAGRCGGPAVGPAKPRPPRSRASPPRCPLPPRPCLRALAAPPPELPGRQPPPPPGRRRRRRRTHPEPPREAGMTATPGSALSPPPAPPFPTRGRSALAPAALLGSGLGRRATARQDGEGKTPGREPGFRTSAPSGAAERAAASSVPKGRDARSSGMVTTATPES